MGQRSMTGDTKLSMSRGRFRPSFAAFSSNWSSSGSEGAHGGRGSFLASRNNTIPSEEDKCAGNQDSQRQSFQQF